MQSGRNSAGKNELSGPGRRVGLGYYLKARRTTPAPPPLTAAASSHRRAGKGRRQILRRCRLHRLAARRSATSPPPPSAATSTSRLVDVSPQALVSTRTRRRRRCAACTARRFPIFPIIPHASSRMHRAPAPSSLTPPRVDHKPSCRPQPSSNNFSHLPSHRLQSLQRPDGPLASSGPLGSWIESAYYLFGIYGDESSR